MKLVCFGTVPKNFDITSDNINVCSLKSDSKFQRFCDYTALEYWYVNIYKAIEYFDAYKRDVIFVSDSPRERNTIQRHHIKVMDSAEFFKWSVSQ